MYENQTFDAILRRALARVPEDVDKREGSIIYDALAPAAMELANLYAQLGYTINQAFADTADRENLVRICAERGIAPRPATKAVLRGTFVPSVELGARFNLDNLNYVVVAHESGTAYKVECETPGEVGNRRMGALIPIDYLDGLESARLTAVLIPGEDEEDTETLRKRFLSTFDSQAFGGNIADYKAKVGALSGVGGVKVHPVKDGAGTVTVVILASDNTVPTAELVETVQAAVDPYPHGSGTGIAPIDHAVTIEAAQGVAVDVTTTLTYEQGYAWSAVEDAAIKAIDDYLAELRGAWADSEAVIVRISQIETRLLEVQGILDVGDTTLNGAAQNLTLGADSVPVRGAVRG